MIKNSKVNTTIVFPFVFLGQKFKGFINLRFSLSVNLDWWAVMILMMGAQPSLARLQKSSISSASGAPRFFGDFKKVWIDNDAFVTKTTRPSLPRTWDNHSILSRTTWRTLLSWGAPPPLPERTWWEWSVWYRLAIMYGQPPHYHAILLRWSVQKGCQ